VRLRTPAQSPGRVPGSDRAAFVSPAAGGTDENVGSVPGTVRDDFAEPSWLPPCRGGAFRFPHRAAQPQAGLTKTSGLCLAPYGTISPSHRGFRPADEARCDSRGAQSRRRGD
jgi:hypothetical protein